LEIERWSVSTTPNSIESTIAQIAEYLQAHSYQYVSIDRSGKALFHIITLEAEQERLRLLGYQQSRDESWQILAALKEAAKEAREQYSEASRLAQDASRQAIAERDAAYESDRIKTREINILVEENRLRFEAIRTALGVMHQSAPVLTIEQANDSFQQVGQILETAHKTQPVNLLERIALQDEVLRALESMLESFDLVLGPESPLPEMAKNVVRGAFVMADARARDAIKKAKEPR
jgi:hypothetical protein